MLYSEHHKIFRPDYGNIWYDKGRLYPFAVETLAQLETEIFTRLLVTSTRLSVFLESFTAAAHGYLASDYQLHIATEQWSVCPGSLAHHFRHFTAV